MDLFVHEASMGVAVGRISRQLVGSIFDLALELPPVQPHSKRFRDAATRGSHVLGTKGWNNPGAVLDPLLVVLRGFSTWSDAAKELPEWKATGVEHYANFPFGYEMTGPLAAVQSASTGGMLLTALPSYIAQLLSPDQSAKSRAIALAMTCHLLGDLATPVHLLSRECHEGGGRILDGGLNFWPLRVEGRLTTMHSVFDGEALRILRGWDLRPRTTLGQWVSGFFGGDTSEEGAIAHWSGKIRACAAAKDSMLREMATDLLKLAQFSHSTGVSLILQRSGTEPSVPVKNRGTAAPGFVQAVAEAQLELAAASAIMFANVVNLGLSS